MLKVGHHGANDATDAAWLNHTDPALGVISANGVTHPRIGALDRLEALVPELLCTSTHGDITLRVDGAGAYTVQVERNAGRDCEPGSQATT